MNRTPHIQELLQVSHSLGIAITVLDRHESDPYIQKVLDAHHPHQTTNHLSIGEQAITIPLEPHEYTYSVLFEREPGYLFFDQQGLERHTVIRIEDIRSVGRLMEHAYGMEYFLSNEQAEFLIAVNWYVIEVVGTASSLLQDLS